MVNLGRSELGPASVRKCWMYSNFLVRGYSSDIMRTAQFHADALVRLLEKHQVATMAELKRALGTEVDMTVLRKLRAIPYLTSYSHRGGYYTLRSLAEFDTRGLWSHGAVRFSKYGTLIDTVAEFVIRASAGHLASELVAELQVEVKQPLLNLVRAGRVAREYFGGLYLYTSPDAKRRRQQRLARQATYLEEPFGPIAAGAAATPDEVKAAIVLFLSTLDEKQRRLFAGLESLRVGRGGDRRIAEWTGMDVHTIAKGRHELATRDLQLDRIRRPGGGRRSVEKKRPR